MEWQGMTNEPFDSFCTRRGRASPSPLSSPTREHPPSHTGTSGRRRLTSSNTSLPPLPHRGALWHLQGFPPFTLLSAHPELFPGRGRPPHTALPSTTLNLKPCSLSSQDFTIQRSKYLHMSRNSLHWWRWTCIRVITLNLHQEPRNFCKSGVVTAERLDLGAVCYLLG